MTAVEIESSFVQTASSSSHTFPSVSVRAVVTEARSMATHSSQRGLTRRDVFSYALALGGLTAATRFLAPSLVDADSHRPLDPVNPDIRFGSTSSLWGEHRDIEWAVKRIAALGLQGIEPYGNQI